MHINNNFFDYSNNLIQLVNYETIIVNHLQKECTRAKVDFPLKLVDELLIANLQFGLSLLPATLLETKKIKQLFGDSYVMDLDLNYLINTDGVKKLSMPSGEKMWTRIMIIKDQYDDVIAAAFFTIESTKEYGDYCLIDCMQVDPKINHPKVFQDLFLKYIIHLATMFGCKKVGVSSSEDTHSLYVSWQFSPSAEENIKGEDWSNKTIDEKLKLLNANNRSVMLELLINPKIKK